MPLGNDIVDLRDPESDTSALHPRFAERVFDIQERGAISSHHDPCAMMWLLWAAKESAYKALGQCGAVGVFSPVVFRVKVRTLVGREEEGVGIERFGGSVAYGGYRLSLWAEVTPERIHALAGLGVDPADEESVLRRALPLPEGAGASRSVRKMATETIARGLGLRDRVPVIVGSRPPVLNLCGRALAVDLSLAHHGSWMAFAASLSRVRS